ncbi:MAG: hypothetical protein J6W03_03450 [Bacteroidaceae bacterium]|nr:hypothetical protein [Bacteroidaceae bacterium]
MRSKYDSMLPSGDSQMQGGNNETGGRHDSPRKQEKPYIILQVVNKLKALFRSGHKRATLYDQKEYERGVKAVLKGKSIVKSTHEAIEMLIDQQTLLGSIPLDAMRNNSSKLVNQDMDVVPLEEMNLYAECILRQVAENMHDSKLMSRYVDELTKKDREKWQQYHLNDTMTLTSLTFFTLGRVQASLTLLSLTQIVPLGDGLYADLCHVSNLGHQ